MVCGRRRWYPRACVLSLHRVRRRLFILDAQAQRQLVSWTMTKEDAFPSSLKKTATRVGATMGQIAASIRLSRHESPAKTTDASPSHVVGYVDRVDVLTLQGWSCDT